MYYTYRDVAGKYIHWNIGIQFSKEREKKKIATISSGSIVNISIKF